MRAPIAAQPPLPLDTTESDAPTLRREFEQHSPLRDRMTFAQAIAHPLIRRCIENALACRMKRQRGDRR